MKITFPECQIEMSAEELILLIDHTNLIHAGTRLVKEIDSYKEHLPGLEPDDRNQVGDQVGDQAGSKSGASADNDPLEGVSFEEPEPKPLGKKGKRGNTPKKVDVRLDNGDWFTFDSVTAAADSIGGSSNGLSTALKNGTKFHGHEVRWNNPELDAALAEIDKSNKTPYQPSSPVK